MSQHSHNLRLRALLDQSVEQHDPFVLEESVPAPILLLFTTRDPLHAAGTAVPIAS